MEKMKFYILYLGDMYSDSNNVANGLTVATVSDPHAQHEMNYTPSYCVLIDHPLAGWILFDTGMPDDPQAHWQQSILDLVITYKPEGTKMTEQLAKIGLKPEDISHVITSHMHMDHTGNDQLFAKTADFYIPGDDFKDACSWVLKTPDRNHHGWIIKSDVLLERKNVYYVEEDTELFPGIEVVCLPGHTTCVLGLIIHLESKTFFFPSDACADHRNYEGGIPAGVYDRMHYRQSILKIKKIEKKYNATTYFSHDEGSLNSLKKAPEFYE